MLHDPNELTMTDLHVQIGEWSLRNFQGKQASDLGVVEELGELTHGILKRFQGIRGFDNTATFAAHTEDALADMAIYLLNHAATNGVLLHNVELTGLPLGFSERRALTQLLMGAAVVVDFTDQHGAVIETGDGDEMITKTLKEQLQALLQKVWDWNQMLALHFGYDLKTIAVKTWLKVRTRDWEKNRKTAHLTDGGYQPAPPESGSTYQENGAVPLVAVPTPQA